MSPTCDNNNSCYNNNNNNTRAGEYTCPFDKLCIFQKFKTGAFSRALCLITSAVCSTVMFERNDPHSVDPLLGECFNMPQHRVSVLSVRFQYICK